MISGLPPTPLASLLIPGAHSSLLACPDTLSLFRALSWASSFLLLCPGFWLVLVTLRASVVIYIHVVSKSLWLGHTSLPSSAPSKHAGFSQFLRGASYYRQPYRTPPVSSCRSTPLGVTKLVPVLSPTVFPARSLGSHLLVPLVLACQSSHLVNFPSNIFLKSIFSSTPPLSFPYTQAL